ncbi:MAG: DUF3160 domain-containing protein [Planctomycetota bacterium]
MNRIRFCLVPIAFVALLVVNAGIARTEDAPPTAKISKLPFASCYEPIELKLTPKPVNYPRALDDNLLAPFEAQLAFAGTSKSDPLLHHNGFIVTNANQSDDLSRFYQNAASHDIPILVTADAVLHLFHVMFDKSLADIEEQLFFKDLKALAENLKCDFDARLASKVTAASKKAEELVATDDTVAALYLATGYLEVVSKLLAGEWLSDRADVSAELEFIQKHGGFENSALFGYPEDYSQYIPRGHYTHSETLKKYFLAMMYMGRLTFLLKGREKPEDDAIVDHRTARIQTLAAALLAERLMNSGDSATYNAIYSTTSFFVGLADDLTPFEYTAALGGAAVKAEAIANDASFRKLQVQLLKLMPPAIYSGTGRLMAIDLKALEGDPSPDLLQKALDKTMGMRFMGQRFVIDSYVMGKMCYPTIGSFTGTGDPFTGKPDRTCSSALDFMSVLGSRAAALASEEGSLTHYRGYADIRNKLAAEIKAMKPEDWRRNLYLATIDAQKALFTTQSFQPFQRLEPWEFRQLQSVLGSWTALRHDTILYAKQPYGLQKGMPLKPPKVPGYVEPEPEFFAKMLSNVRMLRKGLDQLGVLKRLGAGVDYRLRQLDNLASYCLNVCIKQIQGEALTDDEKDYMENIVSVIKSIQGEDPKEFTTVIVADVFTDTNTKTVVEEGTGMLNTMAVVFALPDGSIDVAVGPVYSYYEFKMPMNKRLTDEAWKKMLQTSPPPAPKWNRNFMPLSSGPLPEERF